jgi:hypothetical protein
MPSPFALSLSKGLPSLEGREGEGFDRLSPNGISKFNFLGKGR